MTLPMRLVIVPGPFDVVFGPDNNPSEGTQYYFDLVWAHQVQFNQKGTNNEQWRAIAQAIVTHVTQRGRFFEQVDERLCRLPESKVRQMTYTVLKARSTAAPHAAFHGLTTELSTPVGASTRTVQHETRSSPRRPTRDAATMDAPHHALVPAMSLPKAAIRDISLKMAPKSHGALPLTPAPPSTLTCRNGTSMVLPETAQPLQSDVIFGLDDTTTRGTELYCELVQSRQGMWQSHDQRRGFALEIVARVTLQGRFWGHDHSTFHRLSEWTAYEMTLALLGHSCPASGKRQSVNTELLPLHPTWPASMPPHATNHGPQNPLPAIVPSPGAPRKRAPNSVPNAFRVSTAAPAVPLLHGANEIPVPAQTAAPTTSFQSHVKVAKRPFTCVATAPSLPTVNTHRNEDPLVHERDCAKLVHSRGRTETATSEPHFTLPVYTFDAKTIESLQGQRPPKKQQAKASESQSLDRAIDSWLAEATAESLYGQRTQSAKVPKAKVPSSLDRAIDGWLAEAIDFVLGPRKS